MKILSWNVNVLKLLVNNKFESVIEELSADIIWPQETKLTKEIKEMKLEKYYKYYNFTKKSGYSGVAIFAKEKSRKSINSNEKRIWRWDMWRTSFKERLDLVFIIFTDICIREWENEHLGLVIL